MSSRGQEEGSGNGMMSLCLHVAKRLPKNEVESGTFTKWADHVSKCQPPFRGGAKQTQQTTRLPSLQGHEIHAVHVQIETQIH